MDIQEKTADGSASVTAGERAFRGWRDAVNSGDPGRMTEFLKAGLASECLAPKVFDGFDTQIKMVGQQSGGIEVVKASYRADMASVLVRSKRGSHFAQVVLFLDKTEPDKIGGLFVLPALDPAAADTEKWPETVAGDAEAVRLIRDRVDRLAKADRFSGVVLVAKGDKVLLEKAVGTANRDFSVPNSAATRFHLGSMNKMFTAIGIARLVEAGKLSFDDSLAKALPGYPNPKAARKITLRHLLTHSAGLPDLFSSPKWDGRRRFANHAEMLPAFAEEPLRFEPGTKSEYSNAAFVVLGAVIEQVSGRDYYEFIRESVYAKAGMNDSDSYAWDEVTPNRAIGYARFDDDPFGINPRRPNHLFLGQRGNGCGGGYATAADLFRFALALRGNRLLRPDLTETLTTGKRDPKAGNDYGYGFEVWWIHGREMYGHTGGGPSSGINSALMTFRDGSYTVAVTGNYDAPAAQDLCRSICDLLTRVETGPVK